MLRKRLIYVSTVSLFIFATACVSSQKVATLQYKPLRTPASDATGFMQSLPPVEQNRKHVHLMHLDGFRADIFKTLLEKGRLPHFQFLLGRGKISFEASTVDKSETFKVIEAYLTGRRDTFITGWWQFNRSQFKFKNYWIDPPEVINYELGLMFPSAPTIYDVVASKEGGSGVAAGFTLHRRSVPASRYTRNFADGYKSVSQHVYYDQAHLTMGNFLEMMQKIGKNPSAKLPQFSSSLLAPADEWGHLKGIEEINPGTGDKTCFKRNDPRTEILFKNFEDPKMQGIIMPEKHFAQVTRKWAGYGGVYEFCVDRFAASIANEPMPSTAESTVGRGKSKWVNPYYILGMIQVDIELGRMIDEMRRIQFYCVNGADHCYSDQNSRGIASYMSQGKAEGSLFENTMFFFTGDHGMVDSKHMMTPNTAYNRSNGRSNSSKAQPLLDYLNTGLGLKAPSNLNQQGPFGINDVNLPEVLKYPFEESSWQSPAIKAKVQEAKDWAQATFAEVHSAIKDKQYEKYWWLLFLKDNVIDPKVTVSTDAIKPYVLKLLTGLYLQGDLCASNPQCYVNEEAQFLKNYYDKNIRFVYGGAALNNGEFFLPSAKGWAERPTGAEIFELRPGKPQRKTVIKTLQDMESVGLIFVRANNELFNPARPVPDSTEIFVTDAMNNLGIIHVKRESHTNVLAFAYQKSSEIDPLGYGDLAQDMGVPLVYRTYEEWNQLSVERKHYYHNVVAGMGTYLFSNNPHIGDVSVMHREGWNFGDNGGGHGGVHREEKLTLMMASGPGVKNGPLLSRARYRVNPQTQKVEHYNYMTSPTVVDIAPTALNWLGYGRDALYDLQLDGYQAHLEKWKQSQIQSFADDVIVGFEKEMKGTAGENMIDLRRIKPRMQRLFQFMQNQKFEVPHGYLDRSPDGNQLDLQN